jgi:hypothetical protein
MIERILDPLPSNVEKGLVVSEMTASDDLARRPQQIRHAAPVARGAPRNGAGTSTEKSWHTLGNLEVESRGTYPTEFAAFDQHKTALLDILRKAYESSPKSEPFDEQFAWHELFGAAIWLFRRKKFDRKRLLPARRRERLLDFANVLKRAGKLADNATQDDVGMDLLKGWWLETKGGDLSEKAVDAVADEITDAVTKLAALETAARRAAEAMIRRAGPREGSGLLRMHDIIGLRSLYLQSTGRQPKGRPFVEFVEEFLVAAGQSGATNDYVAEALKYAGKKARKEFLKEQRQTTAFR